MIIDYGDEIEYSQIGKLNLTHDIRLPEIIGSFGHKPLNRFDTFVIKVSHTMLD